MGGSVAGWLGKSSHTGPAPLVQAQTCLTACMQQPWADTSTIGWPIAPSGLGSQSLAHPVKDKLVPLLLKMWRSQTEQA